MNKFEEEVKKQSFFDRSNTFLNVLTASLSTTDAIETIKNKQSSRRDLQQATAVFCYHILNRNNYDLHELEIKQMKDQFDVLLSCQISHANGNAVLPVLIPLLVKLSEKLLDDFGGGNYDYDFYYPDRLFSPWIEVQNTKTREDQLYAEERKDFMTYFVNNFFNLDSKTISTIAESIQNINYSLHTKFLDFHTDAKEWQIIKDCDELDEFIREQTLMLISDLSVIAVNLAKNRMRDAEMKLFFEQHKYLNQISQSGNYYQISEKLKAFLGGVNYSAVATNRALKS